MADPDLQRVDNALAGLGTQVDPTDPDVFLGTIHLPAPGPAGEPRYNRKATPKLAKQSEANLVIRDTLELKRWEKVLLDAGKIEEGKYDYSTLVQLWEAYVQESAAWLAKGKRMSPYDLVELDADLSGSRKKKDDGNGKSTNTQTSTSVDLTDPTTARGIIDSAYQSATGQAPTDAQREDFLSMLNDAERRHPSVSTGTQTTSTTGSGTGNTKSNTTSSTSSSGGVNPQQLAQDQAMQDPGYGSYQAATTYANALFEALRSPV